MKKYHEVQSVQFEGQRLRISVDGEDHEFQLSDISERLANASELERNKYQISPSGYGIHWPSIDEDLSIDGLLGIQHDRPKKKAVPV